MDELKVLVQSPRISLYKISSPGQSLLNRFIASTPESRAICNNPLIYGLKYTTDLTDACAAVFSTYAKFSDYRLDEMRTTVLHVLRGGLNFGLREALGKAFGWNAHSSAFISAQRVRDSEKLEEWYITEDKYCKVTLHNQACIVFADVVATGTSLAHALKQLLSVIDSQDAEIEYLLFITIGGVRSEEILAETDKLCRERFKNYKGASVIYLEGRFEVAKPESNLSLKITGTDLLRCNSILAPEFIESQYENPAFPIERCTIYDAGSRAFSTEEYLQDVTEYWKLNLELAKQGLSYQQLLHERFPELDQSRVKKVTLEELCSQQLAQLNRCLLT